MLQTTPRPHGLILTINAGSSSIKFGVFEPGEPEPRALGGGTVELGETGRLSVDGAAPRALGPTDHAAALDAILHAVEPMAGDRPVGAIGHRIVHGGDAFAAPAPLDDGAMETLEALVPLAPLHQPHNLAGVRAARRAYPQARQVGVFDTAFHRTQPPEADLYALPAEWAARGVRSYGFHGLSYTFIAERLRTLAPGARRVVVAHLGNGASMCGLKDGRAIGSTMGFSPLDGLVMGTRVGQLDPAVPIHLMDRGMDAREIEDLLYRRAGLLGVSALSHDMRVLEAASAEGHEGAALALSMFARRARSAIGALAADLEGLDALVLTGGIGENSGAMRAAIVRPMGWLGLELDEKANARGLDGGDHCEIGTGAVRVLAVQTDEERVIARAAAALL